METPADRLPQSGIRSAYPCREKQLSENRCATTGSAIRIIRTCKHLVSRPTVVSPTKLFGKNLGGIFGINYSKSNRRLVLLNRSNAIDPSTNAVVSIISNTTIPVTSRISWRRPRQPLQLNPKNKISAKAIVNVNAHNNSTQRNGDDYSRAEQMRGNEFRLWKTLFHRPAHGRTQHQQTP